MNCPPKVRLLGGSSRSIEASSFFVYSVSKFPCAFTSRGGPAFISAIEPSAPEEPDEESLFLDLALVDVDRLLKAPGERFLDAAALERRLSGRHRMPA